MLALIHDHIGRLENYKSSLDKNIGTYSHPNKLAYKQMPQIRLWVNGVERAGNSVIRMDEIDPIPKLSGILVWSIWLNCQRKFHCTIEM